MKVWEASNEINTLFFKDRSKIVPNWIWQLEGYVKEIIDEVQNNKDEALTRYIKKFDKVEVDFKKFIVEKEEIERAYEKVTKEEIFALKFSKKRIESFQKALLKRLKFEWTNKDKTINVNNTIFPIDSVGCYVPGGYFAYPSSLLMTVIPAKIAKVPRVIVCSPPKSDYTLDPILLVASDICEVNEIYKIGGAHAIAALAYGTESIKPVKKIVGAGNRYVTTAKLLVSKDSAIDMPAGPSELVILADDSANPYFITLDLVSQAEHSPDSVCGLITTSKDLANQVIYQLKNIKTKMERKEIVISSLDKNGFMIICKDIKDAINIVNDFAPEHLEVLTKNNDEVITNITSAGIIYKGAYTPVSAGDYCIGTNHILPTGGSAKVYSNLSVVDFVKRVNIVECSKNGLEKMVKPISILARKEGFINHARAVENRFNKIIQ